MYPTIDDRDREIIAARKAELDDRDGVRVGDFVRFADGITRRVSHIWANEAGEPESVQTSDGGSYYLGSGYVSMSGSLHSGIPAETLSATGETADGQVWIFHHDRHTAHNGVDFQIPFRVFTTTVAANGQ